jgi:hypothetical protein
MELRPHHLRKRLPEDLVVAAVAVVIDVAINLKLTLNKATASPQV